MADNLKFELDIKDKNVIIGALQLLENSTNRALRKMRDEGREAIAKAIETELQNILSTQLKIKNLK